MRRYWGIGLTVLLVIGALLLPRGWFALRDASTMGSMHGEALDPLTVTQLDRSYERNIYKRLSSYLEAAAIEDVVCSQKDIDQEEESLWDNISQAQESVLMTALQDLGYYGIAVGRQSVIESCTQYVLMKKSDGQILLVANDIHLLREDGCHTEMLIDGVDGTVYYAESEERAESYEKYGLSPWMDWFDSQAVDWMWLLCDNYQSENINSTAFDSGYRDVEENISAVGSEEKQQYILQYTDRYIGIISEENKQSYCCLLAFGNLADSWTVELEAVEEEAFSYRLRLGLHQVIRNIPELAEKVAFTDYWSLTGAAEETEAAER
ncbi:MAG: hypothetical protein J6B43_09435 [Lachnospiraceae bacterium]|nr:hypothetical protein [Lachnospiraceae bacterium]